MEKLCHQGWEAFFECVPHLFHILRTYALMCHHFAQTPCTNSQAFNIQSLYCPYSLPWLRAHLLTFPLTSCSHSASSLCLGHGLDALPLGLCMWLLVPTGSKTLDINMIIFPTSSRTLLSCHLLASLSMTTGSHFNTTLMPLTLFNFRS